MSKFGRLLAVLGHPSKSQLSNKNIFVDDMRADVEVIKGFRNDYFFAAMALHFRIANSTELAVRFAVKLIAHEIKETNEIWEYSPGSHGLIAPNAKRSFSTKKMKLNRPIQLHEGVFQFESSIRLAIEYEETDSSLRIQNTEQIKAALTTNRQGNSLRYKFDFI